MDPNPQPSSRKPTNLDLMEELSEKNLYSRMPGFGGLRDETDPIKAEEGAMRALQSGQASPAPVVNGPQRVTGEYRFWVDLLGWFGSGRSAFPLCGAGDVMWMDGDSSGRWLKHVRARSKDARGRLVSAIAVCPLYNGKASAPFILRPSLPFALNRRPSLVYSRTLRMMLIPDPRQGPLHDRTKLLLIEVAEHGFADNGIISELEGL